MSSAGDYVNEDDDVLYTEVVEEPDQKEKFRISTKSGVTESFDGKFIPISQARRDDLILTLRDGIYRDLEGGKSGLDHLYECLGRATPELRRAMEILILSYYDSQDKQNAQWK